MQLSDFTPGLRVFSKKWITPGTVDHPAKKLVHVLMDDGKMRALPVEDLTIYPETSAWVRYAPKLTSTRQYSHVKPEVTLNAAQRRARRRTRGAQDISRMMLPAL